MGLLNKKSLYDLSQGRGDAGSNLEDQIGNRIEPGGDREADIGSPNGSPFRGNMREFSNTGTDDHMVHLLQGNIDSESDFDKIEWVTGEDEDGDAITSTTNPHSELTWTKVKEEMDKL